MFYSTSEKCVSSALAFRELHDVLRRANAQRQNMLPLIWLYQSPCITQNLRPSPLSTMNRHGLGMFNCWPKISQGPTIRIWVIRGFQKSCDILCVNILDIL